MKLYSVVLRKNSVVFKYIADTRYVFYNKRLHKSNNTEHTLHNIWGEGIRIKINETI